MFHIFAKTLKFFKMLKNLIYVAVGFALAMLFGDKIKTMITDKLNNTNTTPEGTFSTKPSPAQPQDADI